MIPPLLRTSAEPPVRGSAGQHAARSVAFIGLGYDAYAHFDLAAGFDANTALISQGMLFRFDGVFAALAALAVLLIRRPASALFALLVAGGALSAVLFYTYVDLGALGPLPNMYEPIWYLEKTLSAIAEAATVVAAGSLLFADWITAKFPQHP